MDRPTFATNFCVCTGIRRENIRTLRIHGAFFISLVPIFFFNIMYYVLLFALFILILSFFMRRRKIPRYIFLTYKPEYNDLHQVIKDNIENTKRKNPGYEVRYYSDSDARKFIEKNYPQYLEEYDVLVPKAYKADLLRLLLVYKYGGVYNDIGHMYLKPIDSFITNETLVVCRDKGIEGLPPYFLHNAIIAATPEHPLIKEAIDVVIENIRNRYYGETPLYPTGPGALGRAFNRYFKRGEKEIPIGMFRSDIKILNHPGVFIKDIDGTDIIKTKFDNYYEIVYPDKKRYYHDLWNDRKVYAS